MFSLELYILLSRVTIQVCMLVVFIVCTCKYRVCGLEKIASVENERVEEIWQFSLNLHIAIVFVLMAVCL